MEAIVIDLGQAQLQQQQQQMQQMQQHEQQEQLHEQHLACTVMSILSISFWIVIWVMHLCALTNARIKFKKSNKKGCGGGGGEEKGAGWFYLGTTLANKTTKKTMKPMNVTKQHTSFSNPNHHLFYSNQHERALDRAKQQEVAAHHTNCHQKQPSVTNPSYHLCGHHHQLGASGPFLAQANREDLTTTTTTAMSNNCNSAKNLSRLSLLGGDHLGDHLGESQTDLVGLSNFETQRQNATTTTTINFNQPQDLSRSQSAFVNLPLPSVSIIKPLVGVDKNLFYNLETFFHLDYPTYEILFCVQDPQDAAILVVEELFKKYPHADAKLFIGGSRVGVNPKINNMQPAYENMKYELLLISDSGISMRPDTLMDMVCHMSEDVALVHQMPFVNQHGRDNFQSIVERVYFGTAHARAYLTADLLNINCPTGMSALMRKCLLDEVGGIKAFSQYLAEDFFFAKSFTERGWKLRISSQPALQNSANSSDTLSTLESRIQRWIKLRFAMVPLVTLLEPFSECMLLGLLGALSMNFLWAFNPFLVFLLHVLLWFSLDYQLLCIIQNGPLTCSKRDYLAAWLIRECTALVVFMRAVADPKVNWRSREFRIRWGGFTEEVKPPAAMCEPEPLVASPPVLMQRATDYVQRQQAKQQQQMLIQQQQQQQTPKRIEHEELLIAPAQQGPTLSPPPHVQQQALVEPAGLDKVEVAHCIMLRVLCELVKDEPLFAVSYQ